MNFFTTLPYKDRITKRVSKRLALKIIEKKEDNHSGIVIANSHQIAALAVGTKPEVRDPQIECIVHGKDAESEYEFGDVVKVRNQMDFNTLFYNGEEFIILQEAEIVNSNTMIGSHTMIVKIDILARNRYKEKTETGIYLPQGENYQHMKWNLQYGVVTQIGQEANKMYPMLSIGDTAIFYHTIESQEYRLLHVDYNAFYQPIYEYRIINVSATFQREILGKIDPKTGVITPAKNYVFLNWTWDLYGENEDVVEGNIIIKSASEFPLQDCHNIEDLGNKLDKYKKERVLKAKLNSQMLVGNISKLRPDINRHRDLADNIITKMDEVKKDLTKQSDYLNKDFLIACNVAFSAIDLHSEYGIKPKDKVIVPYKILYPITSLFGKKYLMCEPQDLIGVVD